MTNTNERKPLSENARKTLKTLLGAHEVTTRNLASTQNRVFNYPYLHDFSQGLIDGSKQYNIGGMTPKQLGDGLSTVINGGYAERFGGHRLSGRSPKGSTELLYRIKPEKLGEVREIVGGRR